MVETEKILKTLKKSFDEVEALDNSIFRCILSHKKKPIAYYYFDTSEFLFDSSFDISKYQENFIAKDYYRTSGWIQWNFYLVFIFSHTAPGFSASKEAVFRETIEKNKEYTRKYVIPIEKFENWIDITFFERPKDGTPQLSANLAARWIEKLENAGLGEVNLKVGREAVVNNYIEIKKLQTAKKSPTSSSAQGLRQVMPRIKSLELIDYRQNTITGNFPLRVVTLLSGGNGTGKTSFLEAIELCICGRNFRNDNKPDDSANVSVLLADGTSLYPHSDNASYRAKDAEWYNTYYPKDNQLVYNFARYNFFDTDAAYRLANDQSKAGIEKAFSRLALGKEVDFLEKRISEILGFFRREKSRTENDINKLQERLNEMNLEQKRLTSPSTAEEVSVKHIIDGLAELNWKKKTLAPDVIQLEETLKFLTNCASWLKEACMMEIAVKRFSISALKYEAKRIADILPQLNKITEDLSNNRERFENLGRELNGKLEEIEWLRTLMRYMQDSRIADLPGLHNQLTKIEETTLRYREALSLVGDADFSWMSEVDTPLHEYSTAKSNEAKEIRESILGLKLKAQKASQRLSNVITIRARIAGATEELLNIQPDLVICPVCSTVHKPGTLQAKLHEQAIQSSSEETEIKQANAKISKLEINANNADRQIADIHALSSILIECEALPSLDGISCRDGISAFKAIQSKAKDIEKEFGKLHALQDYMMDMRFSESEYEELKEKLPPHIRTLKTEKERSSEASKLLHVCEINIENLRKQCNELEDTIKKATNEITKFSKQLVNRELGPQELHNALQAKASNTSTAIAKIENCRAYINIEDDTDIFALQVVARRVQETISTYLDQKHNAKVTAENIKLLTARISSDNKLMLKYKENVSRCILAETCLSEILTSDSSEKAMAEFGVIYRTAILQVFMRIQSPREFDDIEFGDSARNLNGTSFALKRIVDGNWASLSEISNGQRSALALAVFLALNQSADSAPPLLLLDDPVAHADDLNILGFLDYLRALVVDGSRQVVFATADEKVAYLFKSKFAFLENDLAIHQT